MRRKRLPVWIAVVGCGIVLILAGLAFYTRTRPGLAAETEADRLHAVEHLALPRTAEGSRAAITAVREYLLDYPKAHESNLRLQLASAVAGSREADYSFVAEQVELAASDVLSYLPPHAAASRKDFEQAGFAFEQGYRGWTDPFLLTDVDGDGSQDVLFVYPGTDQPGACCLFRHTPQGWVSHRLAVGEPILGLWTFDIAKGGPKAILLAGLADSEYDPNLFVDVFVWQNDRLDNVLSTKIPHGFQLDHKDVDGDGRQEIRLFGNGVREGWNYAPRTLTIYRWDGRRFALQETRDTEKAKDGWSWLAEGMEQLEAGRFREAAQAFRVAAAWKTDSDFDDPGRQEAWYFLGLSEALQGDHPAAVAAMRKLPPQGDEVLASQAQKFLRACPQPRDLPQGIAAVGQGFRLLEQVAGASRPDTTPKAILAAAGIQPDTYQEVDLTGDGRPGGLARFHWPGGSAVVALQRSSLSPAWSVSVLAYGLEAPPSVRNAYPLQDEDLFYLPEAPALQIFPVATDVSLSGVRAGSGPAPEIALAYRQGGTSEEGVVRWDGEHFAMVRPLPKPSESFGLELNLLEALLFERRAYREALDGLAALEERVRRSSLSVDTKTELLLEAFYQEAICYRKLGQTHRAAVIYAALWRQHPENTWGQLAKRWLALDSVQNH